MERSDRRLFIVSSKLPIHQDLTESQASLDPSFHYHVIKTLQKVSGELEDNFSQLLWAGIPPTDFAGWPGQFKRLSVDQIGLLPIFTHQALYEKFEGGFTQSVLLPVYNNQTPQTRDFENFDSFLQVNQNFCEVLSRHLRAGDSVWIIDPYLLALPNLLRKTIPELSIAIFLFHSFSSYKYFSLLSETIQERLLEGVLGADLIGFSKTSALDALMHCIQMVLGMDKEDNTLRFESRLIQLDVFTNDNVTNFHENSQTNSLQLQSSELASWVKQLATALSSIKKKQTSYRVKFLDEYSKRKVLDDYRSAKKKLLLLDYDGTLVPFASKPDDAIPGTLLLRMLDDLSQKEGISVYIISGRSSGWLEQHFGATHINLIAEHGARKKIDTSGWITEEAANDEWKRSIIPIMQSYASRCANSFVEEKDYSLVWHYRNAAPVDGRKTANELATELNKRAADYGLQVLPGNKIIEIRKRGLDKGSAIQKILSNQAYDFIFAAGDDKTDEDMFRHLLGRENCFTVKVGTEASYAHYNLHNPYMIISLLEGFNHLSPARLHF